MTMERVVELEGRPLRLRLTGAAERALAGRDRPLTAVLELYFSCLIRKRVVFLAGEAAGVAAGPGLWLDFRPVMTRACRVDEQAGGIPLTDFPLARRAAFTPRWARLDHDGAWRGEFGW